MNSQYVKKQAIPMPIFLRSAFIIDLVIYAIYFATLVYMGYDAVIGNHLSRGFFNKSSVEFLLVCGLVFIGGLGDMVLVCGFPRALPFGYLNVLGSITYIAMFFNFASSALWQKIPEILPFMSAFVELDPLKTGLMRGGFCMLYCMALLHLRIGYSINVAQQKEMQRRDQTSETIGGMGTIGRNFYVRNAQEEGHMVPENNVSSHNMEESHEYPKQKSHWFLKFLFIMILLSGGSSGALYYFAPEQWKQGIKAVERISKFFMEEVRKNWNQQPPKKQVVSPNDIVIPSEKEASIPTNSPMILQESNSSQVITFRKLLESPISFANVKLGKGGTCTLSAAVSEICEQVGIPYLVNKFVKTDVIVSVSLTQSIPAGHLLNSLARSKNMQYVLCPNGLYLTSDRKEVDWSRLDTKKK